MIENETIAIDVRQVKRVYGGTVTALAEIDLQIPVGRFVALKGRSGSGKTTLLNCIGGLDQPTSGDIYVYDHAVHQLDDEAATAWRQKEVGFVFQSFGLLPTLSAYENVDLMLRIAGFPRRERQQRVMECLQLVGLETWMHHRPYELSGGQQQRIAIARAIANKPKVILADEATGELDSETAREILSLLKNIAHQERVTILLASHDSLVDEYVDEVVHLVDGRIHHENGHVQAAPRVPKVAPKPIDPAPLPAAKTEPQTLAPTFVDVLLAVLVGVVAMGVYLRTLAPDILYSDSAEFQTLAYTLGVAHPTGYSVYMFIARLFGFLPIGTLAWRVNLLSAVAAAGTVAGVFLLGCYVTKRRVAAVFGSLALLVSYTFWSQAVIAEVYTLGTLWWVLVMLALWHWGQRPFARKWWLFAAALLSGISLGLHLYSVLIAPAALFYFVWIVRRRDDWRRLALLGAVGTAVGLSLFLLSFYAIDVRQSVTGYDYAAQYTSGTAWGVTAADMQTFWQRLYQSITAPQWQSAMFPGGLGFMASRFGSYLFRLLAFEFGLISLVAAVVGWRAIRQHNRPISNFLLVGFLTILILVINYEPGDKHIFYLPTYITLVVAMMAGFDRLLTRAEQWSWTQQRWGQTAVILLFVLLIGQHFWPSRLVALAAGKASFVTETYPYPVEDLTEPRHYAETIASSLPDDAFVMLEWRTLYAVYYVTAVEQERTGIQMVEPTPYRTEGQVQPPLLAQIEANLRNGRPVYTDDWYDLAQYFNLQRERNGLFRLSLRE
ncbi:MAG: ATP-binding cassette domain-containing protein [Ardenticatenaceae bacterium]|nr:ATP-binding cassette domain-containing protein [Ardenticatenaceae bacterium]